MPESRILVAVNQDLTGLDALIRDGDEVAFAAGNSGLKRVRVEPLPRAKTRATSGIRTVDPNSLAKHAFPARSQPWIPHRIVLDCAVTAAA